jgi:hypothetical protein
MVLMLMDTGRLSISDQFPDYFFKIFFSDDKLFENGHKLYDLSFLISSVMFDVQSYLQH